MTRDHDYEKDCLDHIIYKAGMRGPGADLYQRRVMQRLVEGGEEYGDDNFWKIGFDEVVRQAREESEDICAWLLGALQVLKDSVNDEGFPPEQANHIANLLIEAAMKGVEAFQVLETARSVWRDNGGETVERKRGQSQAA